MSSYSEILCQSLVNFRRPSSTDFSVALDVVNQSLNVPIRHHNCSLALLENKVFANIAASMTRMMMMTISFLMGLIIRLSLWSKCRCLLNCTLRKMKNFPNDRCTRLTKIRKNVFEIKLLMWLRKVFAGKAKKEEKTRHKMKKTNSFAAYYA